MTLAPAVDLATRTAWMLMHDKEFATAHRQIPTGVWPRGSIRYLVYTSHRLWDSFGAPLTDLVVSTLVNNDAENLRKNGTDPANALMTYRTVTAYPVDAASLPAMRQACHDWLSKRFMEASMNLAQGAIARGEMDVASKLLTEVDITGAAAAKPPMRLNAQTPDFMQTINMPKAGLIRTGLPELDRAWGGGYGPELGMVTATTGAGKTMLLCKFAAEAIMQGKNVVYDTHELTAEQIRERISLAILRKGRRSVNDKWDVEFDRACLARGITPAQAGTLDIVTWDTWDEYKAGLERFKNEHGRYPDAVFMDSPDDMAPIDGQSENMPLSLLRAFTFLRSDAEAKGMGVWASGQLTRDAAQKARQKLSLKDIGGAYAKAQKAHFVLLLAQTEAQRIDQSGAKADLAILKDSLHGTPGSYMEVGLMWGQGDNGFPGLIVNKTFGAL